MSILFSKQQQYSKQINIKLGEVLLMKKLTFIMLAITTCLSFSSFAQNQEEVVYNLWRDAETIDPHLTTDVSGSRVIATTMEGLLRQGEKLNSIVPAGAESYTVSKDGKTWNFKLRKDAKWSNGDPVTAHDYVYGQQRMLEPETAASYSYMHYYIVNAKEFNEGEIDNFSKVGVTAIDDYTLEIKLQEACAFFAELLVRPTFFPLNEKFYNKVTDEYALYPDTILYNGPYVLKDFISGSGGKYEFEKNPYYWNKDNVNISKLKYVMVEDQNTAANMFKNDELMMTEISGNELRQFTDTPEVVHTTPTGLYYLRFNTENNFFQNKNIRKAVGMAINRDIFCNSIREDGSIPAYAVIPEGTDGGNGTTFRERFGMNIFEENIEEAKILLEKGLEEIGHSGPVDVTLLLDNTPIHIKSGQFLQEELRKNLGLNVTLAPNTFQTRLQKTSQKDYDFVFGGWVPDYNDPMTYLDLWTSWSLLSHTGWENEKYDELINKTNSTVDNDIRMKSMAEAERILADEMPFTPLYYSVATNIIKPELKDVKVRTTGIGISFDFANLQS